MAHSGRALAGRTVVDQTSDTHDVWCACLLTPVVFRLESILLLLLLHSLLTTSCLAIHLLYEYAVLPFAISTPNGTPAAKPISPVNSIYLR